VSSTKKSFTTKRKKEVILELVGELVSLTLVRMRQGESLLFQFSTWDGTPELLDEPSSNIQSGLMDSWETTIRALDEYHWHRLLPVKVHPAFRERLWTEFCSRIVIEDDEYHNIQAWSTMCGVTQDEMPSK
jgi:hypothetical protein